ncbi:MAG: branched-chain amino acid ABC transporter permease [Anaerolineae bacterium]|nr:branched-chain amino acid ABC transporter permease [Anaerolineae bacterium]
MTSTRATILGLSPQGLQLVLLAIGLLLAAGWLGQDDCSASGTSCFGLVQLTLNGVLVGGVYALVALGIVVVNKASGVFNFAHGYLMLAGALIFWQAYSATPSLGFAALLAGMAGFMAFTMLGYNPNTEDKRLSRLGRLRQQATHRRFWVGVGMGLGVALLLFWLLRNLESDVQFIITWRAGILRGAISAVIGSTVIGLVVERFAIRPLLGKPLLTLVMMTLAVGLLIQGITALIWGTQQNPLPIFTSETMTIRQQIAPGVFVDNTLPGEPLPNYTLPTRDLLGEDLSFTRNLVWGFGIALLGFVGFVAFFQLTPLGLAMRAAAENQMLAQSVGLRVRTLLAVAWAIAAVMAMAAGVIQGTGAGVGVSAIVIPPLAFRAFPAVLLGGLESITGALVGGILIGVVEVLATGLIDSATGQEFAPFAVLMVVLLIRPDGLFGERRVERV